MADSDDLPAVVVLGAAGGIGSALARLLKSKGYQTLLAGRTAEKLAAIPEVLDAPHRCVDATDICDVEACLTHARDQFGSLVIHQLGGKHEY